MQRITKIKLFFCTLCMINFAIVMTGKAVSVNWFLGAAMVNPGKELAARFNTQNKNIKVNLIISGSGDLLSRIEAGRAEGIYTPGSTYFLNLAEEKGLIKNYVPLLVQTPVFALSESVFKEKPTFQDICSGKYVIVVGNPRVMALGGMYRKFKDLLPEKYRDSIKDRSLGINAMQIVNYLKTGNAQVGYLFKPIAEINGLSYVQIPEKYKLKETAYFCILKKNKNINAILKFKKFVFCNKTIFEKYGFKIIEKKGQ